MWTVMDNRIHELSTMVSSAVEDPRIEASCTSNSTCNSL